MSGQVSSVAAVLAVLAIGALARAARSRSARSRVRGRLPVRPASPAATSTRARPAPAWFASALDAAAIDVDPDRAWWAAVAGVCMLFAAGGLLGGPALAVLTAGATAGGTAVALRTRRGRSMARLEAELPVALEAIARSLRSGATMRAAVAEAVDATSGRLGAHLARVDGDVRRGVPMVDALDAFACRLPLPGVRLAVAALGLGIETGGANARAIDGVAATLRDRAGADAEARALSAQTRASVLVIALSPAAFCAFAVATDARTARFFFRSPAGLTFLAAGLALDGAGALWMRRLSRVTP
jgi:tight adherence protein B